jgi:N6-L-threonylcarbamoyladenine synthase
LSFLILGIETSCDETAASVVAVPGLTANGKRLTASGCEMLAVSREPLAVSPQFDVRSSIVASQFVHSRYGGVVPELASRAHIRLIVPVVKAALEVARVGPEDLNLVAATYAPGLLGALLVGLPFGKALAWSRGLPFVGVNHLEGHVFAVFLQYPEFTPPFIVLIVSGGHTELLVVEDRCRYRLLGATLDDACGEAFDKAAKMLGFPYPGGAFVEERARGGRRAVKFPLPQIPGFDFSFSGLKTSLLYYLRDHREYRVEDVCFSFQETLIDVLLNKIGAAMEDTAIRRVAVTGGVAVNGRLRERLFALGRERSFEVRFPDKVLCTDNAAVIAACGYERFQRFGPSPLSLAARSREAIGQEEV